MNRLPAPVLLALLLAPSLAAQERIDTAAIRQIRSEGFEHSRVLETATGLSDLSPPRLAGSPGYLAAAGWARDRLRTWGIADARLEPWGPATPSWVLDRFIVEMTSPWYLHLTAFPRAWSPSTARPVEGNVVQVSLRDENDFAHLRGTLRGRIVLNGGLVPPVRPGAVPFRRFTDAELDSLVRLTDPGEPRTAAEDIDPWREMLARRRRLLAFLAQEGALALLEPTGSDAALEADGWYAYPSTPWVGVPAFVVARDHFNRLLRLSAAGRPVRLALSLKAHTVRPDSVGYNVVAEIPGTDAALHQEVVLLGGHLDSWLAGTGAADNAAGAAIVMEALRILQAQGLSPRRTIRLGLWDGEEPSEDYAGSAGYARRHTGSGEAISAYLNVDNGSGRIRGIYLQGNSAARPLFEALLAPLADLGANHVTVAATGETDHISFVAAGIPAFQFIQDPLDYEGLVHHSNLDTADYLVEDDLKQAAVVLATVAWHLANRDERVPGSP